MQRSAERGAAPGGGTGLSDRHHGDSDNLRGGTRGATLALPGGFVNAAHRCRPWAAVRYVTTS